MRKNASIFAKNTNQETPFNLALQDSKFIILDAILENHDFDDINEVNNDNLALFHVVCMRDKTNIINKFFNANFPINSHANFGIDKWQDYTPLHFAVTNKNRKIVYHLLENNADVCVKNAEGFTPLHIAFHNYNWYNNNWYAPGKDIIFGMTRECIKKSVNPVDSQGVRHFHICCLNDSPDIIQFFVNHGVDVNIPISSESNSS